ncbi:hypothetical protein [Gracilibacillus phocaeensis]|uniref:hypothetical protein n=1 Tax=Gracilibacillus phocaeensis TaxID=2042304 RepID=UPI001030089D|nr:hypothetical protein [Gracilibacillus phocaeensis]
MIKKNRMTKEELVLLLKSEQENGYPLFRDEMVKVLQERYNVDLPTAKKRLWKQEMSDHLTSDVEWSQHMGPHYWAKFILEHFKDDLPRRTKELIFQN